MAKHRPASTIHPLILAAILLFALGILTPVGCGGDTTESSLDGSGYKQVVIDEAAVAEMNPAGFRLVLDSAADRMIDSLGGDEAAFYASLLVVDRGYDAYQLLTGALNDQVEADGRILSTDGQVLSPARTIERIIHISGDEARSGDPPVLLASTSGGVLLAYAGDLEDATVTLADISDLPVGDVLDVIETKLEEEYAKVGSVPRPERKYTRIAMILASRGYNAKQVVEAALLDQIRVFIDPQDETGDSICWYIEHPSGVVLKPVHPPVDILAELNCPAAGKNAPQGYDPQLVKKVLDNLGIGEFAPPPASAGSGAPSDGEAAAGGQEPPAETHEDLDGIKDGLYLGDVYFIGEPNAAIGWFFEFPESTVELVVTDDGITATVEFVQRWSARITGTDPSCIATVRLCSVGQGPVTNPLSLTMEPVVQEIVSLEGEDCGDYQETLDDWVASNQTRILTGTFSDGRFEGDLGKPYGVRAETGG